ncbi:putative histidine methyltransferase [Clavispora lusitaniae]|uniref:Histidine methyltransferase n=1 Tax=Clavispora lusitaniae TaxID=36911 RepID=A0ACD0WQC6_CLALS|nr:putative histidine methyltransferase [Clavispora lusitaniae]QFZ35409.1 putative histidine methyltransferase [Clavispora lusitaniae]QFZ41103.1 putative histidine methyltransferase [Clavispora lusitaniae]QFZ46784.1 putative histidine methyltransferase [Clavispora lusitaniae]QFZ52449.1 putative histidine methyltransferase [Clavispora lusitaniae]
MSFAFGFSGDDFDSDPLPKKEAPSTSQTAAVVSPPKLHSLSEITSTLHDVRLTFDNYTTPNGNIVYRRELFDIKHQVMSEEDEGEVHQILLGTAGAENDVDLRKNVYEGGFKSWECSYDLVDELERLGAAGDIRKFSSFLELGAGTALPTCYLLMMLFTKETAMRNVKLVLSDFNYEVLRLVCVPNLIIHWASTLAPEKLAEYMVPDIPLRNDELLLTPALLEEFSAQLNARNIEISFISGSWGPDFVTLAAGFDPDVILSSETIYSLDTLPIVLDTLLQLLKDKERYLALVAAKHYYFGVGGSIREFVDRLEACKPDTMKVDTIGHMGHLKRDIVRLHRK